MVAGDDDERGYVRTRLVAASAANLRFRQPGNLFRLNANVLPA
jgi:hypothetical protein